MAPDVTKHPCPHRLRTLFAAFGAERGRTRCTTGSHSMRRIEKRGLTSFLLRGYILHRTRGHWAEVAFFSIVASIILWLVRLVLAVLLAIISALMLAYFFTR